MEDALLFVHIGAAAAWIGGGLFLVFSFSRLIKSEGSNAGGAMTAIAKYGGRYFGPAGVLVLLSGVGLVIANDSYGWTDTFVLVGIGAFVASGIWQSLGGGKSDQRLLDDVAGDASNPMAALRRWQWSAAVDLGILAVALWAMVVKLGT